MMGVHVQRIMMRDAGPREVINLTVSPSNPTDIREMLRVVKGEIIKNLAELNVNMAKTTQGVSLRVPNVGNVRLSVVRVGSELRISGIFDGGAGQLAQKVGDVAYSTLLRLWLSDG